MASDTASARVATPNLANITDRCFFTLMCEIPYSSTMSLFSMLRYPCLCLYQYIDILHARRRNQNDAQNLSWFRNGNTEAAVVQRQGVSISSDPFDPPDPFDPQFLIVA